MAQYFEADIFYQKNLRLSILIQVNYPRTFFKNNLENQTELYRNRQQNI